jgi:putative solute:sodium symporter small subunit
VLAFKRLNNNNKINKIDKIARNRMPNTHAHSYWKANIRIVVSLLCVWFFISFGCGILLADYLDQFRFQGFKLGFWMAQQGSIYGFVILIIVYIRLMDNLDKKYNLDLQATLSSEDAGDSL